MSDTETPGLFLTLEGIDGAGKSTHLERLVAAFRNAGRTVVLTREPGGTELAERLRDLVLRESMDALTEALVVFAARRDHLERVIRPALARGDVVVSDRFSDASFAYQGGGRQLDWEVLQTLERWVQTAPGSSTVLQPDLCLWLDLPPELAARRRSAVRSPDRFESQDLAFFERVAGAYARRLAQSPERFCRVDATEPVEAVWRAIAHALQGRGYLP